MQSNAKFAVAIHSVILVALADQHTPDQPITSENLGRHVATNPVFVRRVFGKLREAGLLRSQSGPGGGWHLAKPAEEISMAAIFTAVHTDPLFTVPEAVLPEECLKSPQVPPVLAECLVDAERAMIARLGETSVADVIASACSIGIDPLSVLASARRGREMMTITASGLGTGADPRPLTSEQRPARSIGRRRSTTPSAMEA